MLLREQTFLDYETVSPVKKKKPFRLSSQKPRTLRLAYQVLLGGCWLTARSSDCRFFWLEHSSACRRNIVHARAALGRLLGVNLVASLPRRGDIVIINHSGILIARTFACFLKGFETGVR